MYFYYFSQYLTRVYRYLWFTFTLYLWNHNYTYRYVSSVQKGVDTHWVEQKCSIFQPYCAAMLKAQTEKNKGPNGLLLLRTPLYCALSLLESRVSWPLKKERLVEMGALIAMLVVLGVVVPLGASKEQLSTRECENLGFTGLALCSDCNSLAEYVKDQGNPSKFPLSFFLNN